MRKKFKFVEVAQKAVAVVVQFFETPKRLFFARGYIYNASRGLPISIVIERERKERYGMAPPLKYKKEYADQIRSIVDRLIAHDEYPSVAGIAVEIGVPKATLCLWASDDETYGHDDIRREVGRARDYREQWLERHGTNGSSPDRLVRFLLSAHAGYVEKTAQDLNVGQDEEHPFKVEVKIDLGDN